MELFDLRDASQQYKKPIEIETALVWSFLKKLLENYQKMHLFSEIADIIITPKNINIYAKKSIVKAELHLLKEEISNTLNAHLSHYYQSPKRNIKIL